MSQKDGAGTLTGGRLDKLVAEGKLKLSSWDADFFSMGMLRLTLLLLPIGLSGGVDDAMGGSLKP